MFSVVLHQPEIAPNTGNIIRLCVNAGARLHLIEPLGFSLAQKQLRRAGLDYHDLAEVVTWPDWPTFQRRHRGRIVAFSTRHTLRHSDFRYHNGDALLFGAETRGLPEAVRAAIPLTQRVRIPMRESSRSLNLSNCVAIALYEAWRQADFADFAADGEEIPPDSGRFRPIPADSS